MIGRGGDCAIVIDETFVSRRQAELLPSADGWTVRQLGGSNPTLLRGEPFTATPLQRGVPLEIPGRGGEVVTIEFQAAPASEATQVATPPPATAPPPTAATHYELIVTAPSGEQRHSLASGGRYSIGRGRDSDSVIAEPFVSRQHAELVSLPDGWLFRQLGQPTLTLRNGEPIGASPVAAGELLEIRSSDGAVVSLRLEASSREAALPPAVSAPPAAVVPEPEPLPELPPAEPLVQSPNVVVEITPDELSVGPGSQAVFNLTAENRRDEANALPIQIEGFPPAWLSIVFDQESRAFPGERRTGTLVVAVPTDAPAGRTRFRVTVWAGPDQTAIDGVLTITSAGADGAPAPPPGIALQPPDVFLERGSELEERVGVVVRNVGSREAEYTLSLEGLQPQWYTLDARVLVPAGQTLESELRLHPEAGAQSTLHRFVVRAALASALDVVAEADGELSIVPPGTLPERRAARRVGGRGRLMPSVARPPELALSPETSYRFDRADVSHQAAVVVRNTTHLLERYEITVEGVPASWYTLDLDEVLLAEESQQEVPLRLHPRPDAAHPAGEYELRIRVAPLGDPSAVSEIGALLRIEGTYTFDVYIDPLQSQGRDAEFVVTLTNTSNRRAAFCIREQGDRAGQLVLDYEVPGRLEPDQEARIPVSATARRNGIIGSSKADDFQLRFTPEGAESASATIVTAQFVHQPLMTLPIALIAIFLGLIFTVTAVVLLFGLFFGFGRLACELKQDCASELVATIPLPLGVIADPNRPTADFGTTEVGGETSISFPLQKSGHDRLTTEALGMVERNGPYQLGQGTTCRVGTELGGDGPDTCTVEVTFTPEEDGTHVGTLQVVHTGKGETLFVVLQGGAELPPPTPEATPPPEPPLLSTSVNELDFGAVDPNREEIRSIELANTGGDILPIGRVEIVPVTPASDENRFSIVEQDCADARLSEEQPTCVIQVAFSPGARPRRLAGGDAAGIRGRRGGPASGDSAQRINPAASARDRAGGVRRWVGHCDVPGRQPQRHRSRSDHRGKPRRRQLRGVERRGGRRRRQLLHRSQQLHRHGAERREPVLHLPRHIFAGLCEPAAGTRHARARDIHRGRSASARSLRRLPRLPRCDSDAQPQ